MDSDVIYDNLYLFIFRLERDKGNLHKELMSSKANADKLNVEKAILEKDAKNHHAKLHEAQGLHNEAREICMLHYIHLHYGPSMMSQGKTPWKDPSQHFTWKDPSKDVCKLKFEVSVQVKCPTRLRVFTGGIYLCHH